MLTAVTPSDAAPVDLPAVSLTKELLKNDLPVSCLFFCMCVYFIKSCVRIKQSDDEADVDYEELAEEVALEVCVLCYGQENTRH